MDGALDAYVGTDDPCSEQTVALSALGKGRMKNVDKNIDKNKEQRLGCNRQGVLNATQSTLMSIFHGTMMRFPTQIIACCVYRCPLSTCFIPIPTEG